MWLIPAFVALLEHPDVLQVRYDACMHGSDRLKRQLLCTNLPELESMGSCDNSHTRKKWGQLPDSSFATASEAEYPKIFCDRIAHAVALAAGRCNHLVMPQDLEAAAAKTAVQKQPKIEKLPPLLEEFKFQVTLLFLTGDVQLLMPKVA